MFHDFIFMSKLFIVYLFNQDVMHTDIFETIACVFLKSSILYIIQKRVN